MFSALIIDPNTSSQSVIEKALVRCGYQVKFAENIKLAAQDLFDTPFQLVVCELQFPDISGLDLFYWLRSKHPNTLFILLCDHPSAEIASTLQWNGGFLIQRENLKSLPALLIRILSYDSELRYQFEQLTPFDITQLMLLSRQCSHLHITDMQSGKEGLICFDAGRIQHAVFDTISGEEAFYAMMALQRGGFSIAPEAKPEYYSIAAEPQHLMASSALKMDQDTRARKNILCVGQSTEYEEKIARSFPENSLDILTVPFEHMFSCLSTQAYDLTLISYESLPEAFKANLDQLNTATMGKVVMCTTNAALKQSPIFHWPIEADQVISRIQRELFDADFEGELLNLQLFDVLQVLSMSTWPRKLECYDAFSGTEGELWLAQGRVLSARFGAVTGIKALEDWVRLKVGHVVLNESESTARRDIDLPVTALLMSLAVQLDQASMVPQSLETKNGVTLYPDPTKVNSILG